MANDNSQQQIPEETLRETCAYLYGAEECIMDDGSHIADYYPNALYFDTEAGELERITILATALHAKNLALASKDAEIAELRVRIGGLEAALREYADEKNWTVTAYGYHRMFMGTLLGTKHGYELAQRTLQPTQTNEHHGKKD
jgi:hypothetical protein